VGIKERGNQMTNLNESRGWEEVDMSAELEKQNVAYEQAHKGDIKISVIKERRPKMRTLKQVNADLDVLRIKAEANHYQLSDGADKAKWGELRAEEEAIREARKQRAHQRATARKDFQAIYDEAQTAGMEAGNKAIPAPMVVQEHSNMMDDKSPVKQEWYVAEGVCGFAWVNVKDRVFGQWLKDMGYGDHDSYYRGVTIWCSQFGQSMQRKEAWAQAFAEVLTKHNIRSYSQSRMD